MQTLEELESDFTAEITATLLAEESNDLSDIIIDRLGDNMRTQTKDTFNIKKTSGLYYDDNILTIIESYRQSIYEALPEYYFHPPTLGGLEKAEEEVIEEIRRQNKQSEEARNFFKPFEQESLYLQVLALTQELAYEKKTSNEDLLQLFKQGWPIVQKLPPECALSFIYILPVMYHVKGNRKWTEKCFTYITGFPVAIGEDYESVPIDQSSACFTIGKSKLGVDTCTAGKLKDGLFEWKITIGPVPWKSVANVLPGSGFEELMEYLVDCFTPMQVNAYWQIITQKEKNTILDNADKNAARLGYTFYL